MQYKNTTFLLTISHHEHKLIKYIESIITPILPSSDKDKSNNKVTTTMMCQKIITLQANDQKSKIRIQNQLECIKDYIYRRYDCQCELKMPIRLEVFMEKEQNTTIIKINTKYIEYQTLSQHFQKRMFQEYTDLIDAPDKNLVQETLYMLEQLFEIVVRAGGINNFFYTPKNIFINPIKKDLNSSNNFDFNKLEVNPFSMVGLRFLLERGKINREEFEEIYASLPPNFFQFQNDKESLLQLNVLIKKRGFAFLILCCLLERVPDMTNVKSLEHSLSIQNVKKCLQDSKASFSCLIKLYRSLFQKLKEKINVDFTDFFTKIFIDNCANYTWEDIYHDLFQKNCINIRTLQMSRIRPLEQKIEHAESEYYFRQEVRGYIDRFWKTQSSKNQQFYKDRELFLTHPKPNQISTLYLIVKINVNFHRTLRYIDLIELMKNAKFSSDQNKANTNFMKILNDEAKSKSSGLRTIKQDLKLVERGLTYQSVDIDDGKETVLMSMDEKQKSLNHIMSSF